MKIHRFIGDFNFKRKRVFLYDKALIKQLRHVLRLKVGSKMILVNNREEEALCSIEQFRKDRILVKVNEVYTQQKNNSPPVSLYCSILKRSNFELVVQKATEIGISEIIPIITKRTVKKNIRYERMEHIIKEAVEQSGRVHIPKLHTIQKFSDSLEHSKQNDRNIMLHVKGEPISIIIKHKKQKKIGIFIAPEGGWDSSERDQAQIYGFSLISLGDSVLRSETAAIIASYLAVKLNKLL